MTVFDEGSGKTAEALIVIGSMVGCGIIIGIALLIFSIR